MALLYEESLETRVARLEKSLKNLQNAFLQSQRNNVDEVAKTDDTANQVKVITPYKETKTAYYGDTECIFYDAPEGNITVFGVNAYTTNRLANRLYVYFDPLTRQTDITISIS